MSIQHPHPTPPGVVEWPVGPLQLAAAHARGGLPSRIHIPETSLFYNLEAAARRFPGKTASSSMARRRAMPICCAMSSDSPTTCSRCAA